MSCLHSLYHHNPTSHLFPPSSPEPCVPAIPSPHQAWAVLLKDSLGIGSAAWCRARLSAASTDTTVWVDFVPSSARSNVLCGRWAVSSSNAAAPSDVIVRGGEGGGLGDIMHLDRH